MADIQIRWSEHEARKPYARPFGVSFLDGGGSVLGSVAVSGADLLYLRQFQAAVMSLSGEMFLDDTVSAAADPQRAWLDRIGALVPRADDFSAVPSSTFDDSAGRLFHFGIVVDGGECCVMDAHTLLEYQEFQATLAHQSGRLYRDAAVEAVDDPQSRHAAWMGVLRARVQRPTAAEAMADSWPWR